MSHWNSGDRRVWGEGVGSWRTLLVACAALTVGVRGLVGQMPSQVRFPGLRGPYLGQAQPAREPVPFAEGIIFPDHCSVTISPDGSEILWAEAAELDAPRKIMSTRLTSSGWSRPEVLALTAEADGDCPVMAPAGDLLLFNSRRPVRGVRGERVWAATRREAGWSDARPMPGAINEDHLHWQVSIDREGVLYFGSARVGGRGKDDIFMAPTSPADLTAGSWSVPGGINSPAHESTPFVSPDGRYLIFSRMQMGEGEGYGGADLFVSYRGADGSWGAAQNLGSAVNSPRSECCPFVSRDGKFLFFLRTDMDSKQVYWVSTQVLEELASAHSTAP